MAVACQDAGTVGSSNTETTLVSTDKPTPTRAPAKTPTPTPTQAPDLPGVLPHEALVTHIYTADPSAHVFEGKLFIYGSHDQDERFPSDNDGGSYRMIDYHVLSIESFDVDPVDHGLAFSVDDIPWAEQQLWAPDCAYKDGTYYFYFPAKDSEGIFYIGVATSDRPEGPFVPEESYIPGSHSMDPCVFIDDDGQAYMVFGGIWGGQLEKWQTGEYVATASAPGGTTPALGPKVAKMNDDMLSFENNPEEIQILSENGEPITAGDEMRRFFEGAWLHKYNDTYYLSYSTGTTHYLVYATSDSPTGPFTYRGKILDPVKGWTTHHSIVEFEGEWYLFYHDAKISGYDAQRNIKYAPLYYNDDGTIQEVLLP
ncbi:MAG: family 43 glycosylhydrolase [Clostridiaceae bacterium]|nr:family 43 glycosylhydrolase [Clostridiaceae bacterium]